ncbi:MAG: RHS repeat-associated core domain-containing protein [Bacteroidales bacterium]|nr:RHS repeat-associated core domain-containing protein [Bacteroidales bacterium]
MVGLNAKSFPDLIYDAMGRQTYSGREDRSISYNILNLPCYVETPVSSVNYSYLSDGNKCGVMDSSLNGYEYIGPFVYSRDGENLTLSSADMSCGRFVRVPGQDGLVPEYWSMDYLGSVRARDAAGEVKFYDYTPYGSLWNTSLPSSGDNPHGFNGKEFQNFDSVNLYDYGARMYSPVIPMWTTPDPLFEKNHTVNPLSFCAGDPVNYVDPDGRNPIYDEYGNLIGTTDSGLQGDAIIVPRADYNISMTSAQVMQLDMGLAGLVNDDAFMNFSRNHSSLPTRPDWDGYLTLDEANEWYKSGNGQRLYVDLRKINLSAFRSWGEKYVGKTYCFNLLYNFSLKDGLVYGNISFRRYPDHGVRTFEDTYNFDMKSWANILNWPRNFETIIGSMYAGKGTPYDIHFYGTAKLKPLVPWLK